MNGSRSDMMMTRLKIDSASKYNDNKDFFNRYIYPSIAINKLKVALYVSLPLFLSQNNFLVFLQKANAVMAATRPIAVDV